MLKMAACWLTWIALATKLGLSSCRDSPSAPGDDMGLEEGVLIPATLTNAKLHQGPGRLIPQLVY